MKNGSLTAVRLRLILSISLIAIALAGAAGFAAIHSMLLTTAETVSKTSADATASGNNLQALQRVEQELETYQSVVNRSTQIVADSRNYQYQNQIINDLNSYAQRSGVTVTNIDFSAEANAASGNSNSITPPAGLRAATISIALQNPMPYGNILRFIKSIENNLTQMQIARVSISQAEGGVASDALSITIFVR